MQVGLDARLGGGIAYTGVKGRVQYAPHSWNPICKLATYDAAYWGCKSYCQWNEGMGSLDAYAYAELLGWKAEHKHNILQSQLKCHT